MPARKETKAVRVDTGKEVRGIARERVGPVPASKVVPSKKDRKQPKHKGKESEEWQA